VVLRGASANYSDPSYASFAASVASRSAVVFEAANDGMLHAFDGGAGAEMWSYIPSAVLAKLNKLSDAACLHDYYVDTAPTVADVQIGSWRTLLVGGLRAGGVGFYALDVTSPTPPTETDLATRMLWEFPNATTPLATRNNLGLSFGRCPRRTSRRARPCGRARSSAMRWPRTPWWSRCPVARCAVSRMRPPRA
jgi:type IV pilus assembly protein PilY1